ncbi:MAG: glycoside hydrolase family 88 protein [Ignavibacteriales bacterium]|nr:glycoside hydrolase family 88 protein [Ignavibacteriales bacterium]
MIDIKSKSDNFQKIISLIDYVTQNPKRNYKKWMWGEALFNYALSELDDYIGEERYLDFYKAYGEFWYTRNPKVNMADRAAPGLVTYSLQKKTGNLRAEELTNKVLHYIKNEPRLIDETVNHLGNSLEGKFYPNSIWVDSLMMFAVFPMRYAAENNDKELLDFAAAQPGFYAKRLMDDNSKLWHHCYWVNKFSPSKNHPFPKNEIYWGRGNGWVIAALPMILQYMLKTHPNYKVIVSIFQETSKALLPYQRGDGYFETVFNKVGKTYRESSATALISAGWLNGSREGWLDSKFELAAIKAYNSLCTNLRLENDIPVAMTEISGPTIPTHILPYLGYKIVPRGENWGYGLAALIFVAIAYEKLQDREMV